MVKLILFLAILLSFCDAYSQSDDTSHSNLRRNNSEAKGYYLGEIYPQPFGPSNWINFGIYDTNFVNLILFNIKGDTLKMLISENLPGGNYSYNYGNDLFVKNLPSGIYFYKMYAVNRKETQRFWATAKLMLIK